MFGCVDRDNSLVMGTPKDLEALDLLHYSPVGGNEACTALAFPVAHDLLLCLVDVEGAVVLEQHC